MLQMGRIFVGLAFWNIVLFGVTIWLTLSYPSRGDSGAFSLF